jgi:hypothetical protein
MQDPPQGSQSHRHDEVQPDGVWYDHVDQPDCCESPVIASLPQLPRPSRATSPPCDAIVGISRGQRRPRFYIERIELVIVTRPADD